jgi:hypothetical protein
MACWEGPTRGNADKNPLRPVLLRINSGVPSRLNNLDKKKVHKLTNVLVQIYYRLLGSDKGISAFAGANEQWTPTYGIRNHLLIDPTDLIYCLRIHSRHR